MSDKKVKMSSLRNDIQKEREGEWVPSRAFPGAEYLLKSTNCPEYLAAQQIELRRIQEIYRDKATIDGDASHVNEAAMVCAHLLKGWRGFDIEYTADVAKTELTDIGQRPLLEDILACASRVGRYKIEFVKEDAKN